MNIAMWSGPRNLSTAMLYSFGARSDCAVRDEPFYAAYLKATGLDHPMADEIVARYETDSDAVARACAAPPPAGRAHVYQKHMAQHMLDGFDLAWMAELRHVFLLRHPARVVASYHAKREHPRLADIGIVRQGELFDHARALTGRAPVVIDSADIRRAPGPALRALCDAIGIGFDPAMLSWPAGGHPDDGIWAAHWYGAVHRSIGFAEPEGPLPDLPPDLAAVAREAMPHYDRLAAQALEIRA